MNHKSSFPNLRDIFPISENHAKKWFGVTSLTLLFLFVFGTSAFAEHAKANLPVTTGPDTATHARISTPDEDWNTWDPFMEMQMMNQNMHHMMDQSLNKMWQMQPDSLIFQPDMDVSELSDRYVVRADLPGLQKDQIKVDVTDQRLTISGERKVEQVENQQGFYRSERSFGSFQRSLDLPAPIKVDQVTAKYENGVLEVVLPKVEPSKAEQTKSVTVR